MNKKKSAPWLQALHAVMPLCISYIPVGLACGVLLQKVGFDPLLSGLLSILVFSGGAQFLVAAKADIVGNKENEAYSVINDIEKNMRQSLPDKKMYIYIETDKYDPNYSRK